MIRTIAFDADDTLWDNEVLYTRTKQVFSKLLADVLPEDEVSRRLDEIEIHNLRYWGYGIKSFALSMIETAIQLSGKTVSADLLTRILDETKAMLASDVQLFGRVADTLDSLSLEYDLMLITKGDLFEQDRKIRHSGLIPHFRYIEVVPEKNSTTYHNLLEKYHIAPGSFVMVGNSLRSDILPVVALGCHAVYIPYPGTWQHENDIDPVLLESTAYHTLDDIAGLVGLIHSLNQGQCDNC